MSSSSIDAHTDVNTRHRDEMRQGKRKKKKIVNISLYISYTIANVKK